MPGWDSTRVSEQGQRRWKGVWLGRGLALSRGRPGANECRSASRRRLRPVDPVTWRGIG